MARQICYQHRNARGLAAHHHALPCLGACFRGKRSSAKAPTANSRSRRQSCTKFVADVRAAFERAAQMGETPVLLTSPLIRPYVRSLIERFRPSTAVLSQGEVHAKVRLKAMGQV
ncbi:MAG: FHIPEP family type III secretion protein [Terricaulis sp.]